MNICASSCLVSFHVLTESLSHSLYYCTNPHIMIVYSGMTVTLLAEHSHLPAIISMIQCTICTLALACHAKCMFTDPGSIPVSAVPLEDVQRSTSVHAMCSHCETYKRASCVNVMVCRVNGSVNRILTNVSQIYSTGSTSLSHLQSMYIPHGSSLYVVVVNAYLSLFAAEALSSHPLPLPTNRQVLG